MVPTKLLVLLVIVGLTLAHPRPQDESDADNVVDAIKGLLTNIANVETAERLEGSNDVVIVQYVEGDLLSSEDGSGQGEEVAEQSGDEVENEESSVEVMSVPPEVEESSVDATDTDTRSDTTTSTTATTTPTTTTTTTKKTTTR